MYLGMCTRGRGRDVEERLFRRNTVRELNEKVTCDRLEGLVVIRVHNKHKVKKSKV